MENLAVCLECKTEIEIVPIGDIHYGNPGCRIDKVKEVVEYIRKTPNAYMIGMGDYLDCILPADKRFSLASKRNGGAYMHNALDELIARLTKIFSPIQHKIIALLTGNHCNDIAKKGYGDPTRRLAEDLRTRYGGYSCFIKLRITPKTHKSDLRIYAYHGSAAGKTTGSVVTQIERLSQTYDADMFLVGHSHQLWHTNNPRVAYKRSYEQMFVNTGAFMETCPAGYVSYAERGGYAPRIMGCPKIIYSPRKWRPSLQFSRLIV